MIKAKKLYKKMQKIFKEDARACKKQNEKERSIELSVDAASKLIPNTLFNYSATLLSDYSSKEEQTARLNVDSHTERKTLLLSQ